MELNYYLIGQLTCYGMVYKSATPWSLRFSQKCNEFKFFANILKACNMQIKVFIICSSEISFS